MTSFQVQLLGPISVACDGARLALTRSEQRLLAVLGANHPDPVPIAALTEALYVTTSGSKQRQSVHSALWRLRKHGLDDVVQRDGDGYRLLIADDSVDLVRFTRLAGDGRDALAAGRLGHAVTLLEAAVECWRGDLFDGWRPREELASAARRALELRPAAIEDWSEATLRLGRPADVLERLVRLTTESPLRERAWALTIDAYRALEQHHDSAACIVAARDRLADVGLLPGPLLTEAQRRAHGSRIHRLRHDAQPVALPPWLRTATDAGAFVGRQQQLSHLLESMNAATRGAPQLVVVCGEAGAGKTRLAAEAARLGAGRGLKVWGGRCDAERTVPYASLVDTITALVRQIDPAVAGRLLEGPLGTVVTGMPRPQVQAPHQTATRQDDLAAAVTELFSIGTASQTAILVVDDLQWASRETLRLLEHLFRVGGGLQLCVIATLCHDQRSDGRQVGRQLGELSDLLRAADARLVELEGLTAADIAGLPDLTAGASEADRSHLAERLRQSTGGNPLFIHELLRHHGALAGSALTGAELADDDEGTLPLALRAILEERLGSLVPPIRRVLTVAAAIGLEFEPDLVRDAFARLEESGDRETVDQALDTADRDGIVGAVPGGSARYRFRHEMFRYALFTSLSGMGRARIHLAVADALEAAPGARRSPNLFRLAHHLHRARLAGARDRVVTTARAAGELARQNLDFDAAARYFEMASHAAHDLSSPEEPELLMLAADALRCAGDATKAQTVSDSACRVARANGWIHDLARAATQRAALALDLTDGLEYPVRVLLDEARERLPVSEVALRTQLRYLSALAGHDASGVGADLVRGREEAGPLLDPGSHFDAIEHSFWVASPTARRPLLDELQRLARHLAKPDIDAALQVCDWAAAVERGETPVACPWTLPVADQSASGVNPYLRWVSETWGAAMDLAAGRFDTAGRTIDRAFRHACNSTLAESHMSQLVMTYRNQKAALAHLAPRVALSEGQAVPLQPVSAQRGAVRGNQPWDRSTALVLLLNQPSPQSRRWFTERCDRALAPWPTGSRCGAGLYDLALLSLNAVASDDRPRCQGLFAALLPWRGFHCLLGHVVYVGSVDYYLGRLAMALDHADQALDFFAAASEQATRLGAAFSGLERHQVAASDGRTNVAPTGSCRDRACAG